MSKNYKLSIAIKQFIIEEKNKDTNLSCRGMAALIKERFQVDLSKSLINNVFKESGLSNSVGRRREKQAVIPSSPPAQFPEKFPEIKFIRQEADFMENGGFFFLKTADLKLGLTFRLAECLSGYFPGLSNQSHQAIIEALIYAPYFKNKKDLWLFIGAEVPEEALTRYSQQLILVPILELKGSAEKAGISRNFIEINDLWKESLSQLNLYIVHFFPPEYQYLDYMAMQARFYCLPGKLEKKPGLLIIQLFYPSGFFGFNDIIWQEGFSSAANRVNDAKIFTPEKEQIWINPQMQFP